jgi:hypothetical protein
LHVHFTLGLPVVPPLHFIKIFKNMFLSIESDCFDERKAFRHFQGESAATQWVKDLFIIIYSKCEKQPLLSTFLYEVVAYQLKLL